MATLGLDEVRRLSLSDRVVRVRQILEGASRELVMHAAADAATPGDTFEVLAAYLVDRWGLESLERDAASHRTSRDKWRRRAALEILVRLGHARSLELLKRAAEGTEPELALLALSLLGTSQSPEAGDMLLHALVRHQHPATRIALHLDRSPLHLAAKLRALLGSADPIVRRWAATLLYRYLDVEGLERDLMPLADDDDAHVRHAALEALGYLGDTLAADAATRRLKDPVSYVRATAARAIGRLDRSDLAEQVAKLLGDPDWWVRFAAKESLERMGPEIWPVLARSLDHGDRFVRNGAAEVFQNLGVLDSFIVMEAATDGPSAAKIDMLRRIALAGGLRLTDSLLERAGEKAGPRVRQLMATIGLERIGAA